FSVCLTGWARRPLAPLGLAPAMERHHAHSQQAGNILLQPALGRELVRVEKEGINLFLRMPLALHAGLLLGRQTLGWVVRTGPDVQHTDRETRLLPSQKLCYSHNLLRAGTHNTPSTWIDTGTDRCGWHKCLIFLRIRIGCAANQFMSLT